MFQPDSSAYEYHINILSIKMKVKFPCRLKIEKEGSLLTGEVSPSDDNRYIFNQSVTLKDQSQRECFQLTVNLLTDKGAKYIGGIIKLYHSELIRSQGQRITLSLSKCIDSEAFCQIKVEQVASLREMNVISLDRKNIFQRQGPVRVQDVSDFDYSPKRGNNQKIKQSKTEFQFPIRNQGVSHDWAMKSKSPYQAPKTVYGKTKIGPKPNYLTQQHVGNQNMQVKQSNLQRQKALQGEIYKEGYQKLKQKYKKQTEINKQQLNKRLALQNSENNLKLQIMRYKLKCEEQQKSGNDKSLKIKEMQSQINFLQQKEVQNGYLHEQINKKDQNIRVLEDRIRVMTKNIDQMRDYSADKTAQETGRIKQLQSQLQNLKLRMQEKQKQLQKQNRTIIQSLHQRELELKSSTDNLQRERKTIADLERGLQNKNMETEKLIQNQKNNCKTKLDFQKSKNEKLQKEFSHFEYQKKETVRELQQIKTTVIKTEYQKKIVSQQFDAMKSQYIELKSFKQKYNELVRQHRNTTEQNSHLQRQLEKTIQNKQMALAQANKQFQDQLQHYKRNNRQLDQKVKTISNKLLEIQGQLQLSRSQQDKIRRNFEGSVKEAADAKEKQKTARKTLKIKEQQAVGLQSQYATLKQKLKSIDQIYKLQIDKAKDEADKYKSQLQSELEKGEQLMENKRQLSIEISQIRIKLQYADERAEKDATNLKEKQNQIQTLIKDHDEQISVLDQNLMNLRLSQKQLSTKIQKYEIENIKLQDRVDKYQKDVKIFDERCNHYENTLKNKIMEAQAIVRDKQTLQKNLKSVQYELNQLKIQYLQSTNERNKYIKMSELLQDQNLKLKDNINSDLDRLAEKEKIQQSLKNEIKNQKDLYASLDLKLAGFKKQTERNRQILFNTIQKCLIAIPLPNRQEGKKNDDFKFVGKESQNSFSEAFTLIINQSKQIKFSLQKQQDQIKQMKQQNQRLQQDMLLLNSQSQSLSVTLHKQIQELDNQLRETREQKEFECMELNAAIEELNNKTDQLQLIQDDLNTQLEELNFANNSLKMDYEAFTEQSNKKIANLKKSNAELGEKVQEQSYTISELDQKCNSLEKEIDNLSSQLQAEKEGTIKRDKQITELKDISQTQSLQLEELKKQKKELAQKVSELELYLNAERQLNEKQKVQIDQSQKKLLELKVFISNLMKQKQIAIKSELEGSQSIINLENQLLQTQKQLQVLKQEHSRTVKSLEIQKEVNKKLQANVKQLENDKQEQKIRHAKTQQKLREKQKQLVNKEEAAKKIEQKSQKMIEKYKTELKQIEEQLTFKNHSSLEQSKDSNQRLVVVQAQLQKKSATITVLQAKIVEFEQQIYSQRQRNSSSQELIRKLKNQSQQFRVKINQMDINLSELLDQCKSKEQKLFQLSGDKYSLQRARDERERQFKEAIQILNSDWENKCDSVREQYQEKIEFVEKERQYFKKLTDQKQKQNTKINNLIKKLQNQQINTRKSFQDKMQKTEQQKLSLFSLKNAQIQRLVEESRTISDNFKTKQSQLRRNTNQLQIARKTISNLDQKLKQYDEKIKGINKTYQSQIEQLKKKDIAYKSFKEAINNHQWHSEREAKKYIQSFIKNFLELSEDKNSQKIIDLVRSLQKTILQILSSKPVEK